MLKILYSDKTFILCVDFMTKEMQKMHWTPWTVVCWTVGSSVFKWPGTVDQRLHIDVMVVQIVEGKIKNTIITVSYIFIAHFIRSRSKSKRRSRSRSHNRRSGSKSGSRSDSKSSRGRSRSKSPVKRSGTKSRSRSRS